MKTISFGVYASPEGEISVQSNRFANIARRIADMIELDPGGMIVLSTDVNAESGSGIINKAKSFVKTWWQRIMKDKEIDEKLIELAEKKGIDTGWSIGNLFKGRYISKDGEVFNEKSVSVDIKGVPFEFVEEAAERLKKEFDQEAVLLIDNDSGKTYLKT